MKKVILVAVLVIALGIVVYAVTVKTTGRSCCPGTQTECVSCKCADCQCVDCKCGSEDGACAVAECCSDASDKYCTDCKCSECACGTNCAEGTNGCEDCVTECCAGDTCSVQ